jgi:DNA mismatch endonuclease (patch repair protein)
LKPGDPNWPVPSSVAASNVMRANPGRDSAPEVALRSLLHRRGRRFRKHHRIKLAGRRWTQPDLVFTRARVAVFVDGCFWHRCPEHGTSPRANSSYWGPKLDRNVARDADTDRQLVALGWAVVRVWEHERPELIADRVEAVLDEAVLPPTTSSRSARSSRSSSAAPTE